VWTFASFIRYLERPSAEQGLVDQVLVVPIRRREAADPPLVAGVEAAPAAERGRELARDLRQDVDPRPDVLAAFGVVGRAAEHRVRPALGAGGVLAVELVDRQPEVVRLAADFVERGQSVVDVEGGVLDPLGHDRAGRLLELHHELALAGAVFPLVSDRVAEEQEVADEVEDRGLGTRVAPLGLGHGRLDRLAIWSGDRPVTGAVGAVDRQCRDHLADRKGEADQGEVAEPSVALGEVVEAVGEGVDLAGQ
jgi:hypothetical protein